MKLNLATALAILGAVSALPPFPGNIQQVLHEAADNELLAGSAADASAAWFPWPWSKPEVETEKLQDTITADALRERAETLYNISQASVKEYGHPTR